MDNPEKPYHAYMSLDDYERAIAASTENDKDGTPIPNFSAIKSPVLITGPDGSKILEPKEDPTTTTSVNDKDHALQMIKNDVLQAFKMIHDNHLNAK